MKKILFTVLFVLGSISCFCFDWPVKNLTKDNFSLLFGQKKANQLNATIDFKDSEQIYASEDGEPLIVYSEITEDSDYFPSTFGSAVIISHKDNLATLYSNLNSEQLELLNWNKTVHKGDLIADTADTGFKAEKNASSFMVIDLKEKNVLNPQLLLPQNIIFPPFNISGAYLKNKNNILLDLQYNKAFQAGAYRLYQKRNNQNLIYKTTILSNGEVQDQITYDSISVENNELFVSGQKKYTSNDVYPDDKNMLIGEINLKPGKFTLTIQITDIKGTTKQENYNITVY